MMFDSGISSLDNDFFRGKYQLLLKNISNSFPNKVGYYARGKNYNEISYLSDLPFAGIGVDNGIDLQQIFLKSKFGFIQGNFNENHLLLDTVELESELKIYSEFMKNMDNLGSIPRRRQCAQRLQMGAIALWPNPLGLLRHCRHGAWVSKLRQGHAPDHPIGSAANLRRASFRWAWAFGRYRCHFGDTNRPRRHHRLWGVAVCRRLVQHQRSVVFDER